MKRIAFALLATSLASGAHAVELSTAVGSGMTWNSNTGQFNLTIGITTGTAADGGALAAEIARAQNNEATKATTSALTAETTRAQAAESAAAATANAAATQTALAAEASTARAAENAALPKAGGSITGDLMVGGTGRFGSTTATGFPTIDVDGTAAAQRQHTFSTGGVLRWVLGTAGGTGANGESGSNAGSNFFLAAYSDAGAFLGNYLYVNRATGVATITHDPVAALDVATKQYVDAHAGSGGSAPTPIVTTYTASGAIAPTDTLSLINCSSACTMTLAQGADTHRIVVKRIGAAVTLTGTFDRTSQSIPMNSSGTILDSVVLDEVAAISSYIVE